MAGDRPLGPNAHPLPSQTYGGFAADPTGAAPGPETPQGETRTYLRSELRRMPRRRSPSPAVAGGAVAAVVAVGVVAGLWATRDRQAQPPPELRAAVVQPAAVAAIDPPALAAPAAVAAAPGALIADPTTAPPVIAAAAPAPRQAPEPTAATRSPAPRLAIAPQPVPRARPAAEHAAAPRVDTCGPECRAAAFAALDRELDEAFAAAVSSGVDVRALGEAQRSWSARRDRVRQEDPDLAEDLYRARIVELQAMAERAGRDDTAALEGGF